MDNLTHSLIGALLGQMGLKRKTALAMPTLIIAANIPDIDAACFFWLEGAEHLAFRRGITHGPIAMLVLPVLLWAAMLWWDGRQPKRDTARPAVHRGWLLALAYIGTISHPAMDWLNNYGIRLLEPFSSHWSYGDSIFIIDFWMWIALIAAIFLSRRREKSGREGLRPAWIGFAAISAYIFANGALTGWAEHRATQLAKSRDFKPELVVASPPPLAFWRRDIFVRGQMRGREYAGDMVLDLTVSLEPVPSKGGILYPTMMDDPEVRVLATASAESRAFLFWSRMPVAQLGTLGRVKISDQRFSHPATASRFTIFVEPKN